MSDRPEIMESYRRFRRLATEFQSLAELFAAERAEFERRVLRREGAGVEKGLRESGEWLAHAFRAVTMSIVCMRVGGGGEG